MLKPVRMCRVECLIAQETKDRVIARLHREGTAQIDSIRQEDAEKEGIGRDRPLERAAEVSSLLLRTRAVSESLLPYGGTDAGFMEELLGVRRFEREEVDDLSFGKLKADAEGVLAPLEAEAGSTLAELAELTDLKGRLAEQLSTLEPLRESDLQARYFKETPYLRSVIGTVPEGGEEQLAQRLNERFGAEYALSTFGKYMGRSVVAVSALKGRGAELEQTLRSAGFDDVRASGEGTFREIHSGLKSRLEGLEQPLGELKSKLARLHAENRRRLLVLEELLRLEEERSTVFSGLGATQKTVYLRMWVPRSGCDRLAGIIEEESQGRCSVKVDEEPENAPTLLDNPKWIRPFESLTKMFSPPRYNQVDPTVITAPTFILFFGFMAADAVYGLLMAAAAVILRRRYGRYSAKVDDFFYMVICGGLSTMLFGILTGGYLGDFLSKYVLHVETRNMWFVLIDPLYKSNAVILLAVTVAVGAVQIIFGHTVGILDKLSRKEYKGVLTDNVSWLLIFSAIPAFYFGQPRLALASFSVGFVMLLWGSGILGLLSVPGSVGNFVSYSRLLALSLTAPGVGMAFNFMSSLLWGVPLVGPVLAACLFIVVHTVMLLMNPIGAFVHSLRLHYVEFYGTFYDGGGVEFRPFAEERTYTALRR